MARRFARFTAVMALALVAAACAGSSPEGSAGGGEGEGGGEGGGGGEELVFAIGGADAQPGGTHTQVVDLWNEQNPDKPVRIEVLPNEADEQRNAQALELQAQGSNFDLLGVDVIWTGEYAVNGWLASLEDVRGEVEDQVLEGPLESGLFEGELFAMPYNTNAGFLYYRTDLIDTAPTTWDEAREICGAAAEEAGISAYVGQGSQYEGMVVNYLEYLYGAGGELLSEDGSEVLLGEGDAATTALEFMRTAQAEGFYDPGFNTMTEEEARGVFQSGGAACMRNWPYAYTLMNGEEEESAVAGNYDIAPIPTFTGTEGGTAVLGGFNIGVNAFSDNVEGAKEFVVWAATNDEVQTLLGERSLPPVKASVYEELGAEDPVLGQLGEILTSDAIGVRPPVPAWSSISEDMQETIYSCYTSDSPPAEQCISDLVTAIQEDVE